MLTAARSMNLGVRSVGVEIAKHFSTMSGDVESSIRMKLQTGLETSHLDIINESYMHNVPKGAETHFKVVVVTDKFEGMPLIKRHRLVNDILEEELSSGVHALSIVAKTVKQWQESDKLVESSPNCRGGFGPYDNITRILWEHLKPELGIYNLYFGPQRSSRLWLDPKEIRLLQ